MNAQAKNQTMNAQAKNQTMNAQAQKSQRPLYVVLADLLTAIRNCEAKGNTEWQDRHEEKLENLCKNHLPSGSGFDVGTGFDVGGDSTPTKLVFTTAYHHMNATGYYTGWTDHTVIVTPAFGGFDIRVNGRNRNGIKEFIGDTFQYALSTLVDCYD